MVVGFVRLTVAASVRGFTEKLLDGADEVSVLDTVSFIVVGRKKGMSKLGFGRARAPKGRCGPRKHRPR